MTRVHLQAVTNMAFTHRLQYGFAPVESQRSALLVLLLRYLQKCAIHFVQSFTFATVFFVGYFWQPKIRYSYRAFYSSNGIHSAVGGCGGREFHNFQRLRMMEITTTFALSILVETMTTLLTFHKQPPFKSFRSDRSFHQRPINGDVPVPPACVKRTPFICCASFVNLP